MQRLKGLNFRKPYRCSGRISEENESVKRGIMNDDMQHLEEALRFDAIFGYQNTQENSGHDSFPT